MISGSKCKYYSPYGYHKVSCNKIDLRLLTPAIFAWLSVEASVKYCKISGLIDLSISLSNKLNENEKQKILNKIAHTISKLLVNKDIISTNISVDSNDSDSVMLSMLLSANIIES